MAFTILDEQNDTTTFELTNVPICIANGLRRTLLTGIPVIAFDENPTSIKINKNQSALHNEMLANRIGLVPINMETTDIFKIQTFYNTKRRFEFVREDRIKFKLNIKDDTDVTSEHFTIGRDEAQASDYFLPFVEFVEDEATGAAADAAVELNNYILILIF